MEIRVYDKQRKQSNLFTVGDNVTLTELAHSIGYYFGLDMDGHTFDFCTKLKRYANYTDSLVYEDEAYFDERDESDILKSTKIKCSLSFKEVGSKLLFVQDLGDQNEFIVTRKK